MDTKNLLLSDIVGKNVYSGKALRGVCRGVCLALKSRTVKYLLCSRETAQNNDYTEFSVSVGCIGAIEDAIVLRRMRTAIPRNCVRFFMGRPIYSEEGAYLGIVSDLALESFVATRVIADTGRSYPASAVAAVGDAVLLRRAPLFPLGRLVPEGICLPDAPAGTIVTRSVLKSAVSSGKLIRLTSSLLPDACSALLF